MEKIKKIKELIEILNKANIAYYQEAKELMSNVEYDKLYDELLKLEKDTGIVFSNSPTVNVGAEILSALPKKAHEKPMLSLDKTKDIDKLAEFLGDKNALLSWKMDGLTIVLNYENGELTSAVTRGNGIIGEVITNNVKYFMNVPISIDYKKKLTIRGEAIIKYSDFYKINEEIEDVDNKYKNPRNLCSGSVRQLNPLITKERKVYFYAFALLTLDEADKKKLRQEEFEFLKDNGFDVVEFSIVNKNNIKKEVENFKNKIEHFDIPSDGLVLLFDDIKYGESLGVTAKFPKNAIAFKWLDEIKQTKLLDIEWSPSRTGLINPIAIFEPVELEGTIVSRASVHNISILENLELGIGDIIKVYKANMIIPQISDNLTRSNNIKIPKICKSCNCETIIKNEGAVKTLHCPNEACPIKHIKLFTLAASRDRLNIEGLSEAGIESFVKNAYIKELADLFKLQVYEKQIVNMEGFGKKSYDKLIVSINKARNTSLSKLIASLGIIGIGATTAKLISKHFNEDLDMLINANKEELEQIDGIGSILAENIYKYFHDIDNINKLNNLLKEIKLEKNASKKVKALEGKIFVITGSLYEFKNRKELEELIESMGAKVSSAVSKKTSYLINNDILSNSSKNKKATELGIKILSEKDFIKLIQGE